MRKVIDMHDVIFAELAEKITAALLSGDFALYESALLLPLRVEPRSGEPYTLHDRGALRKDFELYANSIRLQNVTDIYRPVVGIVELDPDWVEVTVETHILRGGERVVDPFKTQFVLRTKDGEWRIATIRSSLGHINWTLGKSEIENNVFRPRNGDRNKD